LLAIVLVLRKRGCPMPRLVTFICIVFGVLGCDSAGTGGNAPEGAQVAASSKSRLTLDQLGAAKVQELAAGNLKAAADLYVELGESHSNIFISPHSISTALAMAYAGARTNTAAQMKEVLHFELTEAELHPAFNALDQELASRGESAGARMGNRFAYVW
jgi:serpin B